MVEATPISTLEEASKTPQLVEMPQKLQVDVLASGLDSPRNTKSE